MGRADRHVDAEESSADCGDLSVHERLLEISVQLNTQHDVDELLQYIIETAALLLDCEAASLLVFDSKSRHLRFAAATGSDPAALASIPVPLSGSVAGRIFTGNEAVIEQDICLSPDHFDDVDQKVSFRTMSLLGVPMRIGNEPVGVLEALNKRSGPFTDQDTHILGILASHASIALRNVRQVSSLEKALTKLQSFDKLKSDFLALASHELRTPLASILGVLDLLRAEVGDVHSLFLQDALEAGEQITQIIDTMAQLETLQGEATAVFRPVDINALVSAARAAMVERETARGHQVTMDLPGQSPQILGVEEGLRTLLENLLENAYQFTPDGGLVSVRVSETADGVIIRIEDSGIGLESREAEKIFGDFYQIEEHLTRTHGGLGLGLTIARRIVERHKGSIRASSHGLGRGTALTVELPFGD